MMKVRLYANCPRLLCSDDIIMKKIFTFLFALFIPLNLLAAGTPQILSDVDASLYQQIFALQDREKINTAINVQNQIADKLLMN